MAAFWSVLATLADFRHAMVLRVTVDGEVRRFPTPLAFVANNAYQLEQFDLAGAECAHAGRFALYVAPDGGRFDLLRFAVRLARRRTVEGRDFELICGRDILVETRQPRWLVARDGEREEMRAPFHFQVRPGALRVLAPAAE